MTLTLASTVEIAPGVFMPRLGLGTYKSPEGREVRDSVSAALEVGYRGVDTASMYGNERGVGEALRGSGLSREDYFVATKVWNDEQGYERTLEACERSLGRLGLDHIDLYLIHWPIADLLAGTWRAMEELVSDGRTRAIGVCNFLREHLEALGAVANTPPAVDQVEHHPLLQRRDLKAYCDAHGITVQAWAPIMRGHAPEVPLLVELARAHGKSPEQVCLRWILQDGVTAIPKSVHRERIEANADVFDFELSDDEMRSIAALDRGERFGRDPNSYTL